MFDPPFAALASAYAHARNVRFHAQLRSHMTQSIINQQIAVMQAATEGKRIQFRVRGGSGHWSTVPGEISWNWATFEFRVHPDSLPPVKIPLTPEFFFRGVAWLRYPRDEFGMRHMVITICVDRIIMYSSRGVADSWTYEGLADSDMEVSFDQKSWAPCYTVVSPDA